MGVWQETCGITRYPIFEGDPCVMVIVDPRVLEGGVHEFKLADIAHVRAVHRGTYNDYGWLEDVEAPPAERDGLDVTLFFHRVAWDRVVGESANWFQSPGGPGIVPQGMSISPTDAAEVIWIIRFVDRTRRDLLSATLFRGAQDHRSLAAYELLLELSTRHLELHRERGEERV